LSKANSAMISTVFIHRPRLAIVISIVISIAGVIALGALPVAQFPDIVPPQVGVTATYPGASAAAVEESVAQVIEAQVNGAAKINMVDTLTRVTGGGDAGQWGDLEYSMRIWLNLDRMASLDITPEDVVNAINSQNTQAAVGRVGAAPLVPGVEFQLNISTQGRLTTVEEFNNIIVRATSDSGVVRIKDIARA